MMEPLKIILENFPHKGAIKVSVPNFPNKPEAGFHEVTLNDVIYIERSDFMEVFGILVKKKTINAMFIELQVGDKGFRRLTKQQAVGLRHAGFVLEVTKVEKDANNEIVQVTCKCSEVDKVEVKPRAFIHWVSDPEVVEIRLYSKL